MQNVYVEGTTNSVRKESWKRSRTGAEGHVHTGGLAG